MYMTLAKGEELEAYRELLPDSVYNPALLLVLGFEDRECLGFIAGELGDENDLHIVYLFVPEEKQRQGIGRNLLSYLALIASPMGIRRFLCNFIKDKDTPDLSGFFSALGFTEASSTGLFTMDLSLTAESLLDYEDELSNTCVISLEKCTAARYNQTRTMLRERKEREKDQKDVNLYMDPGPKNRYVQDISFIAFDKSDNPAGLILFRESEEGYVLDYLCVFNGNKGRYMMALFAGAAVRIMDSWTGQEVKKPLLYHGYHKSITGIAGKLGLRTKKLGDAVWVEKYI